MNIVELTITNDGGELIAENCQKVWDLFKFEAEGADAFIYNETNQYCIFVCDGTYEVYSDEGFVTTVYSKEEAITLIK